MRNYCGPERPRKTLQRWAALIWPAILLSSFLLLAAGCAGQQVEPVSYSHDLFVMDTAVNITVYAADEATARQAAEAAAGEFSRINDLTGRFPGKNLPDPQGSDVYRVNQAAGIGPVQVSDDTLTMVSRALHYARISGGAFDLAIGPVMDLWGFGGDPRVPDEAELAKALLLADWQKIVVDQAAKTIYLPEKGMVMDLGGVAKGYATDKAAEKLRSLGITSALINAGGNVFALGGKPDGSPWRIGIQDPRDSGGVLAILQVKDSAVVSSGDYQRYFERDGVRYHHIIDPASGLPARDLMGTTVIMDNSTDADILSTLLFVLGPEKGLAFQKTQPGVEAVLVTPDKKITVSSGLEGTIELQGLDGYTVVGQ